MYTKSVGFCLVSFFLCFVARGVYELNTPYGACLIQEPVLIELIECPSMQRLKDIHQYGISYFVGNKAPYSRYEHSLGVLFFVRTFGGSLCEQIAALLHDVSHTVFSHVGDFVFRHRCHKNSYQDMIHMWFLSQTEIPAILEKYGFAVKDIDHKRGDFAMLDSDIPNLCADRIEYILYGGLLEGKLSQEDVSHIVDALDFKDGEWFFNNSDAAQKYATTSLYLTEHVFGSAWNSAVYQLAAKALRRAMKLGFVTSDDIHFSTDPVVWKKLCESDDGKLKKLIKHLRNASNCYEAVCQTDSYDFHVAVKFRGVDPLVKVDGRLLCLSLLDNDFAALFRACKHRLAGGHYLRLTG